MRATALSILLLLSGCAAHGNLANSLPKDESSRQIFRTVLQGWLDRNDRGNAIYVSKTAYLPPESELEKFSACASNLQAKAVELSFDPVSKVAGSISNPRFHFISTRLWRAPDPKQINAIIEEGRPAGIISLSSIAFDERRTVAVLHFSMACGSLCGYGETIVLDKTSSGWIQRPETCDAWMS